MLLKMFMFGLLCVSLLCSNGCAFHLHKKDSNVIVASYNIRVPVDKGDNTWAKRLPRIRKVIEQNKLDIFGVQEALKYQLENLTEWSSFGFVGGGRNDFQSKGEYSAIIYNKNKFELLEFGTFGLSEQPEKPGVKSWGTAYPRIATWGLFRVRATGKKFRFYNTHLDHISELARVNGIKLIVAHAKKNGTGEPMILTGDFNARPDSKTYKIACGLLNDSKAKSVTKPLGPNATYHGFAGKRQLYLDYIFVSDNIRVLSHKVDDTRFDGKYPSDHDPVVAELFF